MYRTIETASFFILFATVLGERTCNYSDFYDNDCSGNEFCDQSNTCRCLPDFEWKNSICVKKVSKEPNSANYSNTVDNQGSGSIVAGILIPFFLVVFVMCFVYVSRKYHIVSWVRNKFRRRNENYDEFMIGNELDDDDEPLQ